MSHNYSHSIIHYIHVLLRKLNEFMLSIFYIYIYVYNDTLSNQTVNQTYTNNPHTLVTDINIVKYNFFTTIQPAPSIQNTSKFSNSKYRVKHCNEKLQIKTVTRQRLTQISKTSKRNNITWPDLTTNS
jgi:hypothetical protein